MGEKYCLFGTICAIYCAQVGNLHKCGSWCNIGSEQNQLHCTKTALVSAHGAVRQALPFLNVL